MGGNRRKEQRPLALLPAGYGDFLENLKERIRAARLAWTEEIGNLPQAVAEIPWRRNVWLLEIEYTLRDARKPIGVSAYKLTKALPPKLKENLPTIEEIEEELGYGE